MNSAFEIMCANLGFLLMLRVLAGVSAESWAKGPWDFALPCDVGDALVMAIYVSLMNR